MSTDESIFKTVEDHLKEHPAFLDSTNYTHERPVFDVNGERIRKGDAVWHKDGGNEFVVRSTNPFEVTGLITGISSTWFKPEEFTHREPDSIKRILEDMGRFSDTFHDRKGWMDGFNGIMERLARYEERGV